MRVDKETVEVRTREEIEGGLHERHVLRMNINPKHLYRSSTPAQAPSLSSSSCCSNVSYKGQFLVSGSPKLINPLTTDNTPKTRKDSFGLNLPYTTIRGEIEAPNINACLSIETAKFLTLVGKSSTQYMYSTSKAVEPAMNPKASTASWAHFFFPLPERTMQRRQEIPEAKDETEKSRRRFVNPKNTLPMKTAGISITAFIATVK